MVGSTALLYLRLSLESNVPPFQCNHPALRAPLRRRGIIPALTSGKLCFPLGLFPALSNGTVGRKPDEFPSMEGGHFA